MPLRRASNKVETFEIDGSIIHALKPDKETWDRYMDEAYDQEGGTLRFKTADAVRYLYRACVKKLENVQNSDGEMVTITDTDEIVAFLSHLDSTDAGRQVDTWLLNLGSLTKEESKNSGGELRPNYLSQIPPDNTTVSSV